MIGFRFGSTVLASTAVLLGACEMRDDTAVDDVSAAETSAGVVRHEAATPLAEPAVERMAPMSVIQSQPGPDGSQVDLLKVAVTGDVLTVTMRCSSEERINSESFDVSKVSVIDDATSQRLGVLKDDAGNWLASNVSGDRIGTDCEIKPGVIWAKFPAPAATSPTVSINFPEIAPFDGIPVAR